MVTSPPVAPSALDGRTSAGLGGGSFRRTASDARSSGSDSFRRTASDARSSGSDSFRRAARTRSLRQAASDARSSGSDSFRRAGTSDGSRRSRDSSATTRTASSTSVRPAKQAETVRMYMDRRRRASTGTEEPGMTPSPVDPDFLKKSLPWLHLLLQAGLVLGGTALSLGLVAVYALMHPGVTRR